MTSLPGECCHTDTRPMARRLLVDAPLEGGCSTLRSSAAEAM
jgi:hypothetical protein